MRAIRARSASGFTLVEVLIASSLAALAMTAVLSCFVFLARNFTRLSNYRALDVQARTAFTYLQTDLGQALTVKTGTLPTASTLTLTLPSSEVTYTYDSAGQRLRRQATTGASPDLYLLSGTGVRCSAFTFAYYTGLSESLTMANSVPYSIKQVEVRFKLESPTTVSAQTQLAYETVSPRISLRNKRAPDGN